MTLYCAKHPKYRAIRRPVACMACFILWALKRRLDGGSIKWKR